MKTYNQSKDLKAIAAEIARQATAGEYRRSVGDYVERVRESGRWVERLVPDSQRAEFVIGTLKLRCNDNPEAIASLIRRYDKGAGKRLCKPRLSAMRYAEKAGYGKDYGAAAIVDHELLPA